MSSAENVASSTTQHEDIAESEVTPVEVAQ